MSRSTTTTTRRTQQPRTLFTPLLESLLSLNPRLFSLPVDIYGSFESLVAHPLTGDFINTDETELLDASVPYLWAQKVNPSLKRKQPPGTTDLTNGSNGVTDTSISGQFCYKCSKTTHTHSHSPLLKCDFCPLLWHTDCLSPPLSTHPPELRADEIEMINLRVVRGLKGRIWGRDGVPFDQNTTRGLGDGPSVVSVRRKWMCPCHSSWAIHDSDSDRSVKKWKGAWRVVDVYDPGTEGVDDADGSSGTDQDVYMFRSKSTSNLGNIEITAATDDDEAFTRHSDLTSRLTQPTKTDAFSVNGVLFRVPEHRLKLDFLRKTRSSSPSSNTVFPRPGSRHTVLGNGQVAFEEGVLGVMFPGFDAGYTSNIGSLFTGTDEQDECEEETGLDVLVDAAQAVEQTNACQENDINMSRDDKDVEEVYFLFQNIQRLFKFF